MSLSEPVITTSSLMSCLCLLCFLPLFSPLPLVAQLSGSGPTRTKRQIMEDDAHDGTEPHIIEPKAAITLLTPRKETYLLVSEVVQTCQNPHSSQIV